MLLTEKEVRCHIALGALTYDYARNVIETTNDIDLLIDVVKAFPFNDHSIWTIVRSQNDRLIKTFSRIDLIKMAEFNLETLCGTIWGYGLIVLTKKTLFTRDEALLLLDIIKRNKKVVLPGARIDLLEKLFEHSQPDKDVYKTFIEIAPIKTSRARRKAIVKLYDMGCFKFQS